MGKGRWYMTAILGVSAFYHDSAAALIVDGEIVAAAQEERFTRKKHDHEFPACDAVADLIAGEQVIGWFQDRMEFGPRALGSRSIIGDARSPQMQSVMNVKIVTLRRIS